MHRIDYNALIGKRFGELTLIQDVGPRRVGKSWKHFVVCRCSCGSEKEYQYENLSSGATRTCGCWKRQPGRVASFAKQPGMANARLVYGAYKQGAVRRGLVWELTFEEFVTLSQRSCSYCGGPPSTIRDVLHKDGPKKGQSRLNGAFIYNGVDRVDSAKGYVLANCVPCCFQCNRAKWDTPLDAFREWVFRLYHRMFEEAS